MRNQTFFGLVVIIVGLMGCTNDIPDFRSELQLRLAVTSSSNDYRKIWANQDSQVIEGVEQDDGSWILDVEANVPANIAGERHRAIDPSDPLSTGQATEWQSFEGISEDVIPQPGQRTRVDLTLHRFPSVSVTFLPMFEPVGEYHPSWTGTLDVRLTDTATGTDLATRFPANRTLELPHNRTFLVHYAPPFVELDTGSPQAERIYSPNDESVELGIGPAPPLPSENLIRDLGMHDVTEPLVDSDELGLLGFDPNYEMLCRVRTEEGCLPDAGDWIACNELFTESTQSSIRVSVRYKDIGNYGCGLVSFTASDTPEETSSQVLQISTSLHNEHPYLVSNDTTLATVDQNGSIAVDATGAPLPVDFSIYVNSNEHFIPTGLTLEPLSMGTVCTTEATEAGYWELTGLFTVAYRCQFSSAASDLADGTLKVMATGQRADGTQTSTFGTIRVVGEPITRDSLVVTSATLEGGEASAFQSTLEVNVQIALTTTQDMTCHINDMTFRLPTPGVSLPVTGGPTFSEVSLTHVSGSPVTQWLPFDLEVPAGTDLTQITNPLTLDIELDSNCSIDSSQTDTLSVPIYLKQDAPQWITSSADTGMLHLPASPWHNPADDNFIPLTPFTMPLTGLTTDRGAYKFGSDAIPSYPPHVPTAGSWSVNTDTSESLGTPSQALDYRAYRVTQPMMLTETQVITTLIDETSNSGATLPPSSYIHGVSAPKKLLYDAISSAVIVVGQDSLNVLDLVHVVPGEDTPRLVNQSWSWTNPCDSTRILDAVVSIDYSLLDTEPSGQGHATYQSQLSLIVESQDGSYAHCTLRNYTSPDTHVALTQPFPADDSSACLPSDNAVIGTGVAAESTVGLGYFPSLDTFIIATAACVGRYQVHSPNAGSQAFSRVQRLDHSVYGMPWKVETDPFSGHFLVHYEAQNFAGTDDSSAPKRSQFGIFEIFPDNIHARSSTYTIFSDSISWDHLHGRPYVTGHPYFSDGQSSDPWFVSLVNDQEPTFESDSIPAANGQVSWHHLSINAGARLGFAVERTGGQTNENLVAFNLDNPQTSPDASWPVIFTNDDSEIIDMVQLGPQLLGGIPEKLQPGGIYTVNVIDHAPNNSAICIQGACVPAMAIDPNTLKFQVPLDWKALDAEISAHITTLSRGLISSPNPADTKLGPVPLPWSFETEQEVFFSCDGCTTIDFVTEGTIMGLIANLEPSDGHETGQSTAISYTRAKELASESSGTAPAFGLDDQHSLDSTIRPHELLQSRDRTTTLAYTTQNDMVHLNARVIPPVASDYRTSDSFYSISSYYDGIDEIYTGTPIETFAALTNTQATEGLAGFEVVAAQLLENNTHVAALATNSETFKLLISNTAHHTAPLYSRPWLTHLSNSTLMADWDETTSDTTSNTYDIATINFANALEKIIITRRENPSIRVVTLDGTVNTEIEFTDLLDASCFDLPDGELLHIKTQRLAGGPAVAIFAARTDSSTVFDKIGAVFLYSNSEGPSNISKVCRLSSEWPAMASAGIDSSVLPSIAYSEAQHMIAITVPTSGRPNLWLSKVYGVQGFTGAARELTFLQLPHAPTSITFSPDGSAIHTVGHSNENDYADFTLVKTQILGSPRP